MDNSSNKNPLQMSLDEIITSKNENAKKDFPDQDEDDILKLQDDDDMMGLEDIDNGSSMNTSKINRSMIDFRHAKKENKSVMWRLKPENVIPERPEGMPPLMQIGTKKSLEEYNQLLQEGRIHSNANPYGSRMSLNNSFHSNKNSSFYRSTQSLANLTKRNRKNDAIGNRPKENVLDPLKKLINTQPKATSGTSHGTNGSSVQQHQPWNIPGTIHNFIDVQKKDALIHYADSINTNFGPKYDMAIQKEIADVQKKPLIYTCGNVTPISMDGQGIDNYKINPKGTNVSLSCRFSEYSL